MKLVQVVIISNLFTLEIAQLCFSKKLDWKTFSIVIFWTDFSSKLSHDENHLGKHSFIAESHQKDLNKLFGVLVRDRPLKKSGFLL